MGFESFQIILRGGSHTPSETAQIIRKMPNVKPDQRFLTTSTYFVVDDGQHVIEVELDNDMPIRVSCRFILSHPPSIDSVFLEFARRLMAKLGMEATICDDVRPEHERLFSLDQFAEFTAAACDYIAASRRFWIAEMGPEQVATRKDLYERIILPKCEPVAELIHRE